MAFFVVYLPASGRPGSRHIVRWGEAPVASIPAQAWNAGEAAAEVPSIPGGSAISSSGGWVYDSTIGEVWFIGAPYSPSPAEAEAAMQSARAGVAAALRASDWAVLPDAPLTAAEKTEWLDYRAALRAVVDEPGFGGVSSAVALPTPPSTVEF